MNVISLSSRRSPVVQGPNGWPLKIVVIESPYDTLLEDARSRQVYPLLLALKIRGYKSVYPYGVLPMDTADYVANHIVLVEDNGIELIPHMGFKSISLTRCKTHYLNFPAYDLFKITDTPTSKIYYEILDKIIEDANRNNEEVGYNGSWTLSAEFRKMKDTIDFRAITNALMANYYRTYDIRHIVAGGSAKYKVDHMKIFMGFDYFKDAAGERLPPLNLVPYGGEPFYMMHLKDFSEPCKALASEPLHQSLWDNRITLQSAEAVAFFANKKKAA